MKYYLSIVFGYLIIAFTGFFLGGGLYANIIYFTNLEANYITFIPIQVISVSLSVYYKQEMILYLTSKK